MTKKIIILDLDGTVADCTHRLYYIEGENRDYNSFFDSMVDDEPIHPIIDLVRTLALSQEYLIIAVTGRPITHLRQTHLWLTENFIPYHAIFMRPADDYRKDTVIKKEILDMIRKEFGEPEFALDDRPDVLRMWRSEGIFTLAVGPLIDF